MYESYRDYFSFDSGIDFMECLQTMELLFQIGEGEAHEQFYSHTYSQLILRTITRNIQNTVQSITIADLKDPKDAQLHYELIYPQIIVVNEWVSQLL